MSSRRVVTGASINCYVNGNLYGRVRSFSFNASTMHEAEYALDSSDPFELSAGRTKVSGKLGVWRTIGDAGAEGAHMATRFEDITKGKYFSLTLIDRTSDMVVFECRYAKVQNQSWTVQERGIMTGEIDFEGLDFSNELRPVHG